MLYYVLISTLNTNLFPHLKHEIVIIIVSHKKYTEHFVYLNLNHFQSGLENQNIKHRDTDFKNEYVGNKLIANSIIFTFNCFWS